jgi:hypothetical protein
LSYIICHDEFHGNCTREKYQKGDRLHVPPLPGRMLPALNHLQQVPRLGR